jgi:hypothetical protein
MVKLRGRIPLRGTPSRSEVESAVLSRVVAPLLCGLREAGHEPILDALLLYSELRREEDGAYVVFRLEVDLRKRNLSFEDTVLLSTLNDRLQKWSLPSREDVEREGNVVVNRRLEVSGVAVLHVVPESSGAFMELSVLDDLRTEAG